MLDVYVSVFVRRRALSFVYKSLIYNFFFENQKLVVTCTYKCILVWSISRMNCEIYDHIDLLVSLAGQIKKQNKRAK